MTDQAFTSITYDEPLSRVARIRLNRPQTRNAQNLDMLYEIDRAFQLACRNPDIHVLIVGAHGPDFSSGHDLAFSSGYYPGRYDNVSLWGEFQAPGAEGLLGVEKELYLELTERWRNAPKPTIAQVQGRCIAGGNMLVWACDLVVAAEDASFRDHTIDMGMCGAEFFNHPYEMPMRRAKEFLLTGEPMLAEEAARLGMVNRVVPREQLEDATLQLAEVIAGKQLFALKTTKEALNSAQDQMGRKQAMNTAFALHQLCHAHNMLRYDFPIDYSQLHPKVRKTITAFIAAGKGDPLGVRGDPSLPEDDS